MLKDYTEKDMLKTISSLDVKGLKNVREGIIEVIRKYEEAIRIGNTFRGIPNEKWLLEINEELNRRDEQYETIYIISHAGEEYTAFKSKPLKLPRESVYRYPASDTYYHFEIYSTKSLTKEELSLVRDLVEICGNSEDILASLKDDGYDVTTLRLEVGGIDNDGDSAVTKFYFNNIHFNIKYEGV